MQQKQIHINLKPPSHAALNAIIKRTGENRTECINRLLREAAQIQGVVIDENLPSITNINDCGRSNN